MAADSKRECLVKPCSDDVYSYDLLNQSRHTYKTWNGWTIGAYVHTWLPVHPKEIAGYNGHTWRDCPVLLVDVRKRKDEHVQFIVAHLYDWDAAVRRLGRAAGFAWLRARLSLREWPASSTHVLSNDFELVYEWKLKTWLRPDSPSISADYAINTRSNKLERCTLQPTTDIGRALQMTSTFTGLLQLPREIRAIIYAYALLDEVQKTSFSCIHLCSMLHRRCGFHEKSGSPWRHDRHALGPLPRLQTPGLLRVCQQIRSEALEDVYRTKTLVVCIPSKESSVIDLNQSGLPDVHRFLRVRVEFRLDCSNSWYPPLVMGMLEQRVQFLQIIIRLEEHGPIPSCSNVATRIGALLSFLKRLSGGESMRYQPLQLTWGVTSAQKEAGDYSCMSTYLSGTYLQHMWDCVHDDKYGCPSLAQTEACDSMGCKLHSRRTITYASTVVHKQNTIS
ncbi:hypothetical protein CC86DRAFT_389126 [Ophiobolus disseminans]|uniref:F-box domain-containing protein n=1 Tax=Ophiobolus disseminans TaxID=1469910 RepID=A0A6A6ZAV2_9PLEO|nr:hypothetical protein CC86DRAFT_389126 [Ophiobolus disseminans]